MTELIVCIVAVAVSALCALWIARIMRPSSTALSEERSRLIAQEIDAISAGDIGAALDAQEKRRVVEWQLREMEL